MAPKKALLIGTGQYETLPALPRVLEDIEQLAGVLATPITGDFDIQLVLDRDRHFILQALEKFLETTSDSDEVALVYLAGHGIQARGGDFYLAARGTDSSELAATAISIDELGRRIGAARTQGMVIILDTCGVGRSGSVGAQAAIAERLSTPSIAALVGYSSGDSVFTRHIAQSLGQADIDLNDDGTIDVSELYYSVVRRNQSLRDVTMSVAVAGPMGLPIARAPLRPVRCFLSYAAGEEVGPLRDLLAELDVEVQTADDLAPRPIGSAVTQAVTSADFVCVFVSALPLNPAVMYEAGVATGSRRPLLSIVASDALDSPAASLLPAPTIRYRPGAEDALRAGLTAYLRQIRPISAQLTVNFDSLLEQALQVGGAGRGVADGEELEQGIAARLVTAGALVRVNERIAGTEVDVMATLPSLGDTFNPVMIEVKSRSKNVARDIDLCFSKLRAVSARIGLLVYRSQTTARTVIRDNRIMVVISEGELLGMDNGALRMRLTKARNELVHS